MINIKNLLKGAQWLSGRVLDSRPRGRRFEPHRCHCVVSLNKNINPSFVLVQPRKTRPFVTERLLMGRKESNQTNKKHSNLTFYTSLLLTLKTSKFSSCNFILHTSSFKTFSFVLSQSSFVFSQSINPNSYFNIIIHTINIDTLFLNLSLSK